MGRRPLFSKRKLQCDQCPRKYLTKFAHRLHLHVHDSCKSSWFKCQTCSKKFSKIIRLVKHRNIHPPPKKRDERKSSLYKKKKNVDAACRRIQTMSQSVSGANAVAESETQAYSQVIQFARDAEDLNIAALPSSQFENTSTENCGLPASSHLGEHVNLFTKFGIADSFQDRYDETGDDAFSDNCSTTGQTEVRHGASGCNFDEEEARTRTASCGKLESTHDLQVSVVSSSNVKLDSVKMLPPANNDNKKPLSCNKCGNKFRGRVSLSNHLQCCRANSVKCTICGRYLANSRNLKAHMNTHNQGKRYGCYSCGKHYAWRYSLTTHLKSGNCPGSRGIKGREEDKTKEVDALSSPVANKKVSEKQKLNIGTDNTPRPTQVISTAVQNFKSKSYAVKSFPNQERTSSGPKARKWHKAKGLSESKDGSKGNSEDSLSMDECTDGFFYPCVDCSKPFRNEDQMWSHFEATHCVMDQSQSTSSASIEKVCPPDRPSNPKQCKICGKIFSTAKTTIEHLATHTGEKNFCCAICDRKFAWKGSLNKHLRRTACGQQPKKDSNLVPDEKCINLQRSSKEADIRKESSDEATRKQKVSANLPISFAARSTESVDKVSGSYEKENGVASFSKKKKCARARRLITTNKHVVLAENFIRSAILRQEGYGVKAEMAEYVDLGSGPELGNHKCGVCGKRYKYKSSLRIHLRDHTGELPYQCSICKERFAVQRFCRKHIIKHGEESTDPQLRAAFEKLASFGKGPVGCKVEPEDSGSTNSANKDEVSGIPEMSTGEKMDNAGKAVEIAADFEPVDFGVISSREETVASSSGTNFGSPERGLPVREARNKALSYLSLVDSSDDEFFKSRKRKTTKKVVRDSLMMTKTSDCDESLEEGARPAKQRLLLEGNTHSAYYGSTDGEDTDGEWPGSNSLSQEESDSQSNEAISSSTPQAQSSTWTKVKIKEKLKAEENNESEEKSKLLFQCKVCDTKFASRFVLRRHEVITGHAKASYECPYCKRIYSEGGAYSNHMYVHQRKNGMKCDICGKELQSRTTFLNHKEMHKKNPFTCKLCFEWFPSEAKLQEHTNTSHDSQKEFKCKYCHKTFDWQSNYTRHMNKHTKKKEFKCKICHYSFNIISNLKRHMVSVHKGETEFGTSTWEPVNPEQVDHVLNRQHQRRDLWKVEDNAEEDDGVCKRRGRLKALKAVNKKKYPCEICKFVCSSRMELTNHLRYGHKKDNRLHTALIHFVIEDENFVCQLCGSVIYIRHSLKNHMLKVHQLDITEDDIAGISKFKAKLEVDGMEKTSTKASRSTKARTVDGKGKSVVDSSSRTNENMMDGKARTPEARVSKEANRKRVLEFNHSVGESSTVQIHDGVHERTSSVSVVDKETQKRPATSNKCSLCTSMFSSKDELVEHLRNFHKIPLGFEESLIELTKDVNNVPNLNVSQKPVKRNRKAPPKKKQEGATNSMERHVKQNTSMPSCPICSQQFDNLGILARHAAACGDFNLS